MGKTGGKFSTQKLAKVDRDQEILKLRREGLSQVAIAERVGLTQGRVWQLLHEYMDQAAAKREDLADEVLTLDLERLDEMFSKLYPKALECDYRAVDRCIRILEMRGRMSGVLEKGAAPNDISVVLAQITSEQRINLVGLSQRIFEYSKKGMEITENAAKELPK